MIDWGAGYFLGLKLGFVLLVIAFEFFFLAFSKFVEGEIGKGEFALQVAAILFVLFAPHILTEGLRVPLWPVLVIPSIYAIFRFFQSRNEKELESSAYRKKIERLERLIRERPDLAEPLISMGDISAGNGDWGKALDFYNRAYGIKETPEIMHKIRSARREKQIQEDELWICTECGRDNGPDSSRCTECGTSRETIPSVRDDIVKNSIEIKRYILTGLFIIAASGLILFTFFIMASNRFFQVASFVFFSFLVYYALKKFFTY